MGAASSTTWMSAGHEILREESYRRAQRSDERLATLRQLQATARNSSLTISEGGSKAAEARSRPAKQGRPACGRKRGRP